MAKGYPTEKLLRKVIDDLSDFLPFLVLAGGWIPYLYQKHVWPDESAGKDNGAGSLQSSTPLTTTDMDFGVTLVSYPGKERKVLSNIKTLFAHRDDKGPAAIERENGADYFISNVRQDAYDRIVQLL